MKAAITSPKQNESSKLFFQFAAHQKLSNKFEQTSTEVESWLQFIIIWFFKKDLNHI